MRITKWVKIKREEDTKIAGELLTSVIPIVIKNLVTLARHTNYIVPEGKVEQMIHLALSAKSCNCYPWEVKDSIKACLYQSPVLHRISRGVIVMPALVQALLRGEKPKDIPGAALNAAEKIAKELKSKGEFHQNGAVWRLMGKGLKIEILGKN